MGTLHKDGRFSSGLYWSVTWRDWFRAWRWHHLAAVIRVRWGWWRRGITRYPWSGL